MQKPFSNWTKLNEKVKAHSVSPIHMRCTLDLKSFKEAHSGVQPTIDLSLDTCRQELYERNCKRIDAIIDCVLCGKQNIALRGHDDANSSQSANKGNYKALLDFRALGDQLLQKHLKVGAKMLNIPVQTLKMKSFQYANHWFWKR